MNQIESYHTQTVSILLVDDNSEFLNAITRMLSAESWLEIVGRASSGEEALTQIDQLRPNLVIMDLAMPGMNGLEITRILKSQQKPPHIIILTLYDNPEYKAAAKVAGSDGFVLKSEFDMQLIPLIHHIFHDSETDGSYAPEKQKDQDLYSQQIEERLQKSEEALLSILKDSPVITYRYSIDSGDQPEDGFIPVFISNNITRLFGYEVKECIGKHLWWTEHIHPDDKSKVLANITRLLHKDRLAQEYRFQTQQGTWRWIRDEMLVVRDKMHNPIGVVGSWMDITEKKQIELQLAEREHLLRMTLNASDIGIWDWDLNTNEVYFSPEWKRQLGYSDQELENRYEEWEDRLHPEDHDRVIKTDLAYIKKPYPNYEQEFRLRHKNGSYRWILSRSAVLADDKGKPTRMHGVHVDITDRKQNEDMLRRSMSRLNIMREIDQAILSAQSPAAVAQVAIDHIGRLIPCLRVGVVTFDFEMKQAHLLALNTRAGSRIPKGRTFSLNAFGDMDILQKGQTLVVQDTLGHSRLPFFVRILLSEGLRSYVKLPLMVQNNLIGSLNVAFAAPNVFTEENEDVLKSLAAQIAIALHNAKLSEQNRNTATILEQHVEALKASQDRLQDLVAYIPEGVCLLDLQRRIVLANSPAQNYLKLLTHTSTTDPITHIGDLDLDALCIANTNSSPQEIVVTGPPRRIFEVQSCPTGGTTETRGLVLVIRDVTHERTVEQRVQQQDRLAAVGQLAAGIAHDFNNMLTVIIGIGQILYLDPDVPEWLKDDLETILTQGQRGAQLVRQVLDFSRKNLEEHQPVNLGPFMKEIVKLLERILPENIQISTDLDKDNFCVDANLTQLQQIMTNLAVNARDAMPNGGTLHLSLSRLQTELEGQIIPNMKAGNWVVWKFVDTGTGISPKVLTHIFEPFFTTKPRGEGTGLGLAQVYGIVKQHGGEIKVDSEEGQGTAITIYLPEFSNTEYAIQENEFWLLLGKGETILVVEDEVVVTNVAKTMLEALGYKVLIASNGQEALEIFTSNKNEIALVLTDLVMPQMGGKQLLEAIKQKSNSLPVVMMSGYPRKESEDVLSGLHISGWLQKPLMIEEVGRVVSEALNNTPNHPKA